MIIDNLRTQIESFKLYGIEPTLIVLKPETEREMFLDGSFEKSEQFVDSIKIDGKEYNLMIGEYEGVYCRGFDEVISYVRTKQGNEYIFNGYDPTKLSVGYSYLYDEFFEDIVCYKEDIDILRTATKEEIELFKK